MITAFSTKRTVERGGFLGYRLVAGAVVVALILIGRLVHESPRSQLWPTPLGVGLLSDLIVLAGTAVAIWARVTLGGNWSAEVTFKEDHELVESGPYALVRHPIYSGLLLMALGTAIHDGRAIAFGLFAALCAALWWKARQEELIIRRHLPGEYADYAAPGPRDHPARPVTRWPRTARRRDSLIPFPPPALRPRRSVRR